MSLIEWPEISSVIAEKKCEFVIQGLDSSKRSTSINDDDIQNKLFYERSNLNLVLISSCRLSHLSSSISNCHSLTKLVVSQNQLTSIPNEIGTLKKLKFLDLSGNELSSLPSSLSNLTALDTFIATGNKLTEDGIFDLTCLVELLSIDLSHNQLSSLPSSLLSASFHKLHTIDFSHNHIKKIDDDISLIAQLKSVNLASNEVSSLPFGLGRMEKIKQLDLSENPFKDGRFKKLANDKRANVSAVLAYIVKNSKKEVSKAKKEDVERVELEEKVEEKEKMEIRVGLPEASVHRLSSVTTVRPHLVCCVINNIDLTGENFRKFINIQTKLHSGTICSNRTIATIGTHDMTSFSPPLQYFALPPQDLYITALSKKTPVSGRELIDALLRDAELSRKRTKRSGLNPLHRYLHLVNDLPVLPCLADSKGLVISLPPITDSNLTKLSESTTSVWVEVSSSESMLICKEVMDLLIHETLSISPSISIHQVRVMSESDDLLSVYPDNNDLSDIPSQRIFEKN